MGCSPKDGDSIMAIIEAIETVYLEADAASVTFDSLGAYEHLRIHISGQSNYDNSTAAYPLIEFNGDTSSTCWTYRVEGYGTTVGNNAASRTPGGYCGRTANAYRQSDTFGGTLVTILDYRSALKNPTIQTVSTTTGNSTTSQINMMQMDEGGAITEIKILIAAGGGGTAWRRGTTMSLYGIKSS